MVVSVQFRSLSCRRVSSPSTRRSCWWRPGCQACSKRCRRASSSVPPILRSGRPAMAAQPSHNGRTGQSRSNQVKILRCCRRGLRDTHVLSQVLRRCGEYMVYCFNMSDRTDRAQSGRASSGDIAFDIAPTPASIQEFQIADTDEDFAFVNLEAGTLLIKSVSSGGAPPSHLLTRHY